MSPFESKSQQRFMHAVYPEMAKEWDEKTNFSKLPEKKKETVCEEEPTKEIAGSIDGAALFKEDIPKAKHFPEIADVFLNVKKDIIPIRGALETSEDDTLMGRLAKRMASRDLIDSLDLGLGTKTQRAGKAAMADNSTEDIEISSENFPKKMNIGGPVLKEGTKIENEHLDTLKKVQEGKVLAKDAPEEIAKDHIKELGPEYYEELPELERNLKKKRS